MAAIAEQGLAQKLLRLAMDAVYHDSLTSMQKGRALTKTSSRLSPDCAILSMR